MTVGSDKLKRILVEGPSAGPPANLAVALRLGAGAVFLLFGIGKFVSHASEVDSFRTYGLPSPEAFVYAIGPIEVVGGALLIVGLGTRLASLVLAGNMVGAIIVSGFGEGELVSLTLAPSLLAAMLYLLWIGPGARFRRACPEICPRLHRTRLNAIELLRPSRHRST